MSVMVTSTGCVDIASQNVTATPDFVTATLPPTLTPPATQISALPASTLNAAGEPTISPIEGTTTTEVNVRAEPSTIGANLGVVLSFSKVQIIGKEQFGKWYQILYSGSPDGKGWVAVAYVQMNAAVEIPVVEIESGSGYEMSGLVTQGINVRSGPGTTYDSLGTLIPNDIAAITGKDTSSKWIQIKFPNSPDGIGWVALEFLQVNNLDSVPVIGDTPQAVAIGTPAVISLTSIPAQQDGDSISSPFAVVIFSPAGVKTLQANGNISAPDGDTEDWAQVTSFTAKILVEVKCLNNELRVEIWNNAQITNDTALACGETRIINIAPSQPYFFRIQANNSTVLQNIQYSLKVSAAE